VTQLWIGDTMEELMLVSGDVLVGIRYKRKPLQMMSPEEAWERLREGQKEPVTIGNQPHRFINRRRKRA